MTEKTLDTVLVKPAGPDCNLACTYCFYSGRSSLFPEASAHRMSEAVLEEVVRQVMEQSGPEVSIGWQGGEPTLMGLPFFEKAVALEERYGRGKAVGNGLQTNGLLLDRAWARFLRRFDVLVGLSIDGPEEVHDRYRRTRGGGPTWARVRDAAAMLLDEGVAVNALTVVDDHSARFPDEIYDFHRGLGLSHMQFIPCVEADPADPGRAAPFSVSPEAWGEFLCRVFDRWRADFVDGLPRTSVRLFESLLFSYAGLQPPECTLAAECGTYVVVEHNGDVYSCDFFVEPRWKLGSVPRDRLADLLGSVKQAEFGRVKSVLPPPCLSCRWRAVCRGGCPKDRLRVGEDGGLNHFCGGFRRLLAHADADLKKLVDERTRSRPPVPGPDARGVPAGRNDPCPCGSGRKVKKCCGRPAAGRPGSPHPQEP